LYAGTITDKTSFSTDNIIIVFLVAIDVNLRWSQLIGQVGGEIKL
jgi:hypothetical protein